MNKNRISISEPHYNKSISKYVEEGFLRNELSNYGDNIDKFEVLLKTYLNSKREVVALNSGTAAIHLALILAGVNYGDEVLCQSMTFSASANPVMYLGAKPIFIDSEEDTWNMCPNHLEEAIKDRISKSKKPKAIIIVHLYGMPAKINEIMATAKKYEIPLIEDAAESLGSIYKGQKCGAFGDFGIVSFNGNKIITTSGGGALVCKNNKLKEKAIFLATQAREDAPHYQHSEIGYNYRMSNILAGIGRGQMEVLVKHIELRRVMNQFYKELFNDFDGITVFEEPNKDFFSNHWLSCIIIESDITGFNREDLRKELLSKKIESRPLWKPMHLQPVFKDFPFYGNTVSETLFNKGLCLPSGSNLTKKDKALIAKTILDYINH